MKARCAELVHKHLQLMRCQRLIYWPQATFSHPVAKHRPGFDRKAVSRDVFRTESKRLMDIALPFLGGYVGNGKDEIDAHIVETRPTSFGNCGGGGDRCMGPIQKAKDAVVKRLNANAKPIKTDGVQVAKVLGGKVIRICLECYFGSGRDSKSVAHLSEKERQFVD